MQNYRRLKVKKWPKKHFKPHNFNFFINMFYPFNYDKPIPYHLTERTRGNTRAKQELLLEETTKYLPFLPKV